MMNKRLPVLLGALALTASCAARDAQSPTAAPAVTALNANAWALSQIGGQPPLPHVAVNVSFRAEGELTGSDGCNVIRGAYEADAATLEVGSQLVSTMMACSTPVNEQAQRFTALLLEARRFDIDGSYLHLRDGDGQLLMTLISQKSTLPGSAWQVSAYNNGKEAVVGVSTGSELTLAFGDNGRVTGSAGCNNYVADFDTEANKVSIGMPRTTRKACAEPAGVMEQEALFLKALQSAATFRINGDRLELRTADSALAAVLQRQEAGKATP
jgi:heat shock protein HslJ